MRAVVQRVASASVEVDGETVGRCGPGFLVLLGVQAGDTDRDLDWIVRKVAGLRVFRDAEGRMNLDLAGIEGGLLVVSQFTLLADCRRGHRPSFIGAAAPELAEPMVEAAAAAWRTRGFPVETGRFGANMQVGLVNDGPVTIVLDSRAPSDA